ncbi:MAG: M20/M25/M40 family metallo-hydrolase [Acidobacteriota bacterium]
MKHFIVLLLIAFTITFDSPISLKAQTNLSPAQKLARDIFKELIEINTSTKVGATKASNAMADRLRKAGFPEEDIHIAGPEPEHMNLVARYHGSSKLKPVLIIGHLDVVEALRSDWSMDPFTFNEKNGNFYGRGTTDMKCEAAEIITNLIRLKQEHFLPDRDIIVALTDHEEGGDANGILWLINNRRDLIGAEFAINLDASGGWISEGKYVQNEIQTCEKIFINYKFEVHNKGGHSAMPVRENAIYRLAAALTRISQYRFPAKLNETTRLYFDNLKNNVPGQMKSDMEALLKIPFDTTAAERLSDALPYYNALMRTTCVATLLHGGHADNALPQTAEANVNCRMLPDDKPEYVLSTLKSVVNDTLVEITQVEEPVVSPISPLRKDILDLAQKISSSLWPGVKVIPIMSPSATDGLYLRRAGIPVYAVGGMFTDINDVRTHGKDEFIGVKNFYNGVEFMYRFIKTLFSGNYISSGKE